MSASRRAIPTFFALVVVATLVWWGTPSAEVGAPALDAQVLAFEQADLQGIRVVRPTGELHFLRQDGTWTAPGEDWEPSTTMMRRIAYQLHDLDARAQVALADADLSAYGLGVNAIQVHLELTEGKTLSLAVGGPNPSGVSWYVRRLPEGPVVVVKKAAVDYLSLDEEAFREAR